MPNRRVVVEPRVVSRSVRTGLPPSPPPASASPAHHQQSSSPQQQQQEEQRQQQLAGKEQQPRLLHYQRPDLHPEEEVETLLQQQQQGWEQLQEQLHEHALPQLHQEEQQQRSQWHTALQQWEREKQLQQERDVLHLEEEQLGRYEHALRQRVLQQQQQRHWQQQEPGQEQQQRHCQQLQHKWQQHKKQQVGQLPGNEPEREEKGVGEEEVGEAGRACAAAETEEEDQLLHDLLEAVQTGNFAQQPWNVLDYTVPLLVKTSISTGTGETASAAGETASAAGETDLAAASPFGSASCSSPERSRSSGSSSPSSVGARRCSGSLLIFNSSSSEDGSNRSTGNNSCGNNSSSSRSNRSINEEATGRRERRWCLLLVLADGRYCWCCALTAAALLQLSEVCNNVEQHAPGRRGPLQTSASALLHRLKCILAPQRQTALEEAAVVWGGPVGTSDEGVVAVLHAQVDALLRRGIRAAPLLSQLPLPGCFPASFSLSLQQQWRADQTRRQQGQQQQLSQQEEHLGGLLGEQSLGKQQQLLQQTERPPATRVLVVQQLLAQVLPFSLCLPLRLLPPACSMKLLQQQLLLPSLWLLVLQQQMLQQLEVRMQQQMLQTAQQRPHNISLRSSSSSAAATAAVRGEARGEEQEEPHLQEQQAQYQLLRRFRRLLTALQGKQQQQCVEQRPLAQTLKRQAPLSPVDVLAACQPQAENNKDEDNGGARRSSVAGAENSSSTTAQNCCPLPHSCTPFAAAAYATVTQQLLPQRCRRPVLLPLSTEQQQPPGQYSTSSSRFLRTPGSPWLSTRKRSSGESVSTTTSSKQIRAEKLVVSSPTRCSTPTARRRVVIGGGLFPHGSPATSRSETLSSTSSLRSPSSPVGEGHAASHTPPPSSAAAPSADAAAHRL